jgi:hypothetical protein
LTAAMILLGSLVQVKGFGVCIGVVGEAVDGIFKFLEGAKYAARVAVQFARKSQRRHPIPAKTIT